LQCPYGFPTGTMLMQKLKNFDYGDNNVDSPSFRPPSYLFDLYYELFGKYQEYANLRKSLTKEMLLGSTVLVENCRRVSVRP